MPPNELRKVFPFSENLTSVRDASDGDPDRFWNQVKSDFNLAPSRLHLTGFWLSSHPAPVRAAIAYYREQLDADPYGAVTDLNETLVCDARTALARICGTSSDSVALTNSTTEGIAAILNGLKFDAGDEVIYSAHDHYSAVSTIKSLASRVGVRPKELSLYDSTLPNLNSEAIVAQFRRAVSSKTRVIFATWIHSATGVQLPIRRLGEMISAVNQERDDKASILFVVDGTHGIGALPFQFDSSGCHVFFGACHKWLHGPRGTGFICIAPLLQCRCSPIIPSFAEGVVAAMMGYAAENALIPTRGDVFSSGGFGCFEHRWSIGTGIRYLEGIGTTRIFDRLEHLSALLKTSLRNVKEIAIVTPDTREWSANIVAFRSLLGPNHKFHKYLKGQGLSVSISPSRERYLRLSPAIYNSEADILDAVLLVRKAVRAQTG